MKKIFVLSAASMLFMFAAHSQTEIASVKKDEKNLNRQERLIRHEKRAERKELRQLKESEISYQLKQHFADDFPNVSPVKWRAEGAFNVAMFTKDNVMQSAYYDVDDNLVGVTVRKKFSDLPEKAQEYINKKYGDYTRGEVIFFDDNQLNETDMVLYGHQFDDVDNYFIELSKDGKKVVLKSNTNGDVEYFEQMK